MSVEWWCPTNTGSGHMKMRPYSPKPQPPGSAHTVLCTTGRLRQPRHTHPQAKFALITTTDTWNQALRTETQGSCNYSWDEMKLHHIQIVFFLSFLILPQVEEDETSFKIDQYKILLLQLSGAFLIVIYLFLRNSWHLQNENQVVCSRVSIPFHHLQDLKESKNILINEYWNMKNNSYYP